LVFHAIEGDKKSASGFYNPVVARVRAENFFHA
jgi:hypothetical protein